MGDAIDVFGTAGLLDLVTGSWASGELAARLERGLFGTLDQDESYDVALVATALRLRPRPAGQLPAATRTLRLAVRENRGWPPPRQR